MKAISKSTYKLSTLGGEATIQSAIYSLNESGTQIVMMIDGDGKLEGTVSDGDIRRGLLDGLELNSPIDSIVNRSPLIVPEGMADNLVIQLMVANKIHQVPVVDEQHHVIGLHLWDEITALTDRSNVIVIMAGGAGRRLMPHTESCPKPMLPVAGKPMLEHIIMQAKMQGFGDFIISLGYLGGLIKDHFGDGANFGVKIKYLEEESPLGTAGALSLLKPIPQQPFVVINGDVLTDIRFNDLLNFHERHVAAATMAIRLHEWKHPFGVVRTNGVEITGFEEKPVSRSHINAGVYVLSPSSLEKLEYGMHCDMPTLFDRLRELGLYTTAFPMHEPWLDVGRPDDLKLATSFKQT